MNQELSTILSPSDINSLQGKFDATELATVYATTLKSAYPLCGDLVNGIIKTFVGLATPVPSKHAPLSAAEQERIVIALLASRGGQSNLAIHIYVAIANPTVALSVDQIGGILLLTGVYTGIDHFAAGVRTAETTLTLLHTLVKDSKPLNPQAVVASILATFNS